MSTNLEAAQTGDRRKALEHARDTAAAALDAAAQRGDGTVAQLLAQYRATLAELDELSAGTEESPADDAAGRVLRLAGA